jgi:hypothetical protein
MRASDLSRMIKQTSVALAGERGNSLPMALVALLVGTLLIVPLFGHLGSTHQQTLRVEANLKEQYASDAGAEYAIWHIKNDSAFRQEVLASGAGGITVTLPSSVNGVAATARVAKLRRQFDYALWSNGHSCKTTFDWIGAGNRLIGNAHSNQEIDMIGADTVVEGLVEYVTDAKISPGVTLSPTIGNPVQTWITDLGPLFYFDEYAPGGAKAVAAGNNYYYYPSDFNIPDGSTALYGLYFVEGDLKTGGNLSSLSGTATFVVRGTIFINGNSLDLRPFVDDLAFFSNKDFGADRCKTLVIEIHGNTMTMNRGYVYAPYGKIKVSGSGVLAGSFIGDSVEIAGSGLTIQIPPPYEIPDGCEGYDVLSIAQNVSTRSRVLLCGASQIILRSWEVGAVGD